MIGHMVMGGVLLLTVILHAGVTSIGTQGWLLYGLLVAEIGSGLWGMAELRATPRRFARFARDDFMYPSAVRTRIKSLAGAVERTLSRRSESLRGWFGPRYAAAVAGDSDLVPACEGFAPADQRFATQLHAQVEEIVRLHAQRRKLDAADRLSRRWLMLHVPVAIALTTFVAIHVLGWLYYG
jgi:hypothetical protein